MSDILKLLDVARKNIFKAQVEIENLKAENEKLKKEKSVLVKRIMLDNPEISSFVDDLAETIKQLEGEK